MTVQFGIILQGMPLTPTFEEMKQLTLAAEESGFHSCWISDHVMHPFPVEGKPMHYCQEAFTTAAALGALTKNIKIGFSVITPTLRHPAVIAKACTTLDRITNGRLILCLGAGSMEAEHIANGIPWGEHDDRVQLEKEAALIIKKFWTEPVVNFSGKHYTIKDAIMEPKPLQKPCPPIWVGGASPKTKELISELADGWLMFGISPGSIKKSINFMNETIGNKTIQYAAALESLTLDDTDKVIARIQKFVKTGVNLLTIPFLDMQSLNHFAKNILPSF